MGSESPPPVHGPGHPPVDLRRELASLLPDLRAYARYLVQDASHSDDLVQDTIVRALAALGQFQANTSLRAWLFTIQRNAFFEQQRRRRRERVAIQAQLDTALPELQMHGGQVNDMARMLWTLPPLLREALVLVGAQEMTHEEAAEICGVPVGTMRARVSRARSKLAEAFGTGARPWEQ